MSNTHTPSSQYRQEKSYKHGSSAYYSYLFVSEDKRLVIENLYAFLHEVTDILYITSDSSVARIKLAWWKEEIDKLFHGKAEHPISQALMEAVKTYGLSQQYFLYIIESVEMDLSHNRYLDWTSLKNFCTMQSGAFACLITQVLSDTTETNIRFAQQMGIAVQFANLLRKLGEDAAQGRIYIPMDFLREHQLKAADILNGKYSDEFKAFMQAQGHRAHELFTEAFALYANLNKASKKELRPCIIRAKLSLKLLKAIEKDQWRVLDKGISLSPLSKLFTAAKVWLLG
ncbi:squalene/phytoene synthase family protein [Pelistega suis]|uniref:Squalene/phytoene synthase family protein n=1 Tax=Pelistega suis TaxID=1631957 RepID=A0A849P2M0_9BURK|nr:squalene/phytoene synthase family protein [Pelistega suis]NOL51720.1 squalene/phytoene synthase family protein [Pelistega suis]